MSHGHHVRVGRRAVVAALAGTVLGTGVLAAAPAEAATAPQVQAQGAFALDPATGKTLFGKAPDPRLRLRPERLRQARQAVGHRRGARRRPFTQGELL
ncbi:hypothetical protein ABT288_39820 [Streptomyces sp. NPDC001093]|uniref:hypothetical protein n=1 Tax=Streptomyces sp. NPDC001093 TaxID=3154376 RepID=UPI00331B9202